MVMLKGGDRDGHRINKKRRRKEEQYTIAGT